MEAAGVDAFLIRGHVGSPWSPLSGGGGGGSGALSSPSRCTESPPYLDFDALQVALTRLDHSPQKGKGCVGRSGALSHRRPPSRGSRRSSADSLHLLQDQHTLNDHDDDDPEPPPAPRVVNIEVKLEEPPREQPARPRTFEGRERECGVPRDSPRQHDKRQELRRRLLEGCSRRTPSGGSNPHLSSATCEAEEAFRRIKQEVARLAAKRRSSTDLSDSRTPSELLWSCDDSLGSVGDSASVVVGRGGEEQRSSSEADVVISDRESVADSGLVSRRTVITISSKKSKSASSLASSQDTAPLWLRDQQTRRSLRGCQPLEEGISVSIVSRDATSRMYVRQSDAEDRPSRASAFNVRRTIEKRQIQQERRERRALRERIREQLRSLSEGRPRRDSSGSQGSSLLLSESSARSKSMSSLDQDHEDERSESPLVKVQSSPTLEREKQAVLTYLYGASNLAEEERPAPPSLPPRACSERREAPEGECSDPWQWSRSWDSVRVGREEPPPRASATQSADSVKSFKSSSRAARHLSDATQHTATHAAPAIHHPLPQESLCEESSPCGSSRPSVDLSERREPPQGREDPPPGPQPVPPPRRSKLSLSTGHIKLAEEEQPHWVRLAKERRSLRAARQVEQLSDRASTASREPEWVARARKKLESLNVTLTATTDVSCASSCVTESSSAWSRGGLDALDDLREEVSRIGQDLAEEAAARVTKELSVTRDSSRMLEAPTDPVPREASLERPKVSFDASATEASDGDSTTCRKLRSRRPQKEEVRFGDLKHDWGGAQTKAAKTTNGKQKEMRFGEIQVEVEAREPRGAALRPHASNQGSHAPDAEDRRPVMRFGDTPLNLFPAAAPRGPQSSSKFESVAGPDPTKMTAEQLNQNVEEYDFPIPTGREDASELLRFLEESLKKAEAVPEVVCAEDSRPRPKSILKRRSVESVVQELRREASGEGHQKVLHHRKSASFDWDCVGKGGDPPPTAPAAPAPTTATTTFTTTFTTTIAAPAASSPTLPTAPATNGHFFNVKLRHVPPGAREQQQQQQQQQHHASTNNDPRRFPSEHSPHRRPSTQEHGAPLPGLVRARERKSVDEHGLREAEAEAERPGVRELLPPPAWATCRAGRGLTSSEEPNSPVPAASPQHSPTPAPPPKAARVHQEPVLPSHEQLGDPQLPATLATPAIQVFSSRGEAAPRGPADKCPREPREDPVTRPPRKKEEEEDHHRTRRGVPTAATSSTAAPGDRRIREAPPSVAGEARIPARHAAEPLPDPPKRVSRGSAEEGSRGPASPVKPSRGRPPGESPVPRLVQVEVVDEEARRAAPRKREEKRGGSGLLEWEARQRQRLEEEERNRLNIGLSLRPVSCRIKELVRMHGAFMSRFTRDKKTDINGTVDGADDILFQKIPQDPSTKTPPAPPAAQGSAPPMRSPFMVKKVQSPGQNTEPPRPTRRDHPRRRSPARRPSPATQRTAPSSRVTSPATRKTSPAPRRKSPTPRGTSPSTRRPSPGPRRRSPAPRGTSPATRRSLSRRGTSPSTRRRSPAPRGTSPSTRRSSPSPRRSASSTLRSTSSSRRSPSAHRGSAEGHRGAAHHKVLTESSGQPSPSREATDSFRRRTRSSLSPAARRHHAASPDRKGSGSRGREGVPRASQIVAELHRAAQSSPQSQDSQGSLTSSSRSAVSNSPSTTAPRTEVQDAARQHRSLHSPSPERSSVKDPKARQEWLTKMLAALTQEGPPPRPASPTLSPPAPASPTHASPSPASPTHTSRSTITLTPASSTHAAPSQDSPSRHQTDSAHSSARAAPATYAHVGPARSLGAAAAAALEGATPVPPARKSALSSLRTLPAPATPATACPAFSPLKTVSSSLTVTLTPTASPLSPHTKNFNCTPSSVPPAAAPGEDSLRTPVKRSPSQESLEHSRRGPVSLSSILSDSSRSSSRCSSPHASPRPSPERILKRESFDLVARLGVIQEGGSPGEWRARGPQGDQKENIAPLPEDESGEDTPSLSAPFRSSFRLRERSEERRKGGRKWSEEYSARDSVLSWRPALTAPAITLRALADVAPRKHADTTWPPVRVEAPAKAQTAADSPALTRYCRGRASLRSQGPAGECGGRKPSLSPEPGSGLDTSPQRPVSLSAILSRGEARVASPSQDSLEQDSPTYKFSPKLSLSEEVTPLSNRHPRDEGAPLTPQKADPPTPVPSPAVAEKETPASLSKPKPRVKQACSAKTPAGPRRSKEGSPAPSTAPRPASSAARNKVVRRNSSLKRNRPEGSLKARRERKNSEEDAHETVVEAAEGTTRTRTTVKRSCLPAADKARPVARSGSGRVKRERSFRSSASRALEDWAASTSVKGHLVKKEGQRFSHETEEEEQGGRRVARSVARRVVRRGSRTLSGGGELLTETKETSSSGVAKDGQKQTTTTQEHAKENEVHSVEENEAKENGEVEGGTMVEVTQGGRGVSRKMKTSTDGERYFTHSITDKHGAKTFTTEGVNNKTTSSVEVIGAKDFDARRAVKGTTGERVVVERTKDPLGRPSTVVKKVTSQSRLVITKTKRKTPVVV
ncbi:serine/arginine repetitive matrix protein 2-like isoform X2 [Scylla paramamosain]|uniref:serine/arginine repetitive matrix protein 2-like isoform X2 n=1 Tax=Scylla paramamosain TaxID=85552 RepID=UPI0030838B19